MRSTFRILFYVKKNALQRDGKAPIMGRITLNGRRVHFATQLSVAPYLWDVTCNRVAGRSREAQHTNDCLTLLRLRIERYHADLLNERKEVTAALLKASLSGGSRPSMGLLSYFRQHNREFLRMVGVCRSASTYYKYRCVERHLAHFVEARYGEDPRLEKIDKKFLTGFHAYILQQSGCRKNTVWVYLIALKHVLTQARNDGFEVPDIFANYKLHSEFVMRNYLSMEEIERLLRLPLLRPSLRLVRDAFLFSCFTGLSFVDVKSLTTKNIQYIDGHLWLVASRTKTGTEVSVRLFDLPRSILERYGLGTGTFIFSLPSNGWCNRCLREIAAGAGIAKKVTFHTARHTFATTITLSQGVAIETISKLLGHKNIRTTQIYATVTHSRLVGEMDTLSRRIDSLCGGWQAHLV